MKTLKFRPHLVPLILDGTKITTWRLFDDKDLRVGDTLELQNWETKENFARAEILAVEEKELGRLTSGDFEGHEKFSSEEDMLRHYREYYGEKVTLQTMVKIIKFKRVE